MNARQDSKEFWRALLAYSAWASTVTCIAVSSSSTKVSQPNNRDEIATDMEQSWKDVEDDING
jgi:anti-sigma-K factor RskA